MTMTGRSLSNQSCYLYEIDRTRAEAWLGLVMLECCTISMLHND